MSEHINKIINNIVKKVASKKEPFKSATPTPAPRKVSQTYDPKNYKGVTWNKERNAYDYNTEQTEQ